MGGKKRNVVVGAVVVVVMLACLWTCVGGNGGERADEGDAVGAYVICKDFVRDRLRAPGTARFPSVTRAEVGELAGDRWRVRAWVDAENAFGGEVRAEWECVVAYVGDDEWRLEGLDIEE